jgi:hypothetical protein
VVASTYVDWGPIIWPRWRRLSCVLTHTGYMEPRKLSSFDVTELDNTLPCFTDDRRDSVRATHGLPDEVFAWKTTLGWDRTRLDSLIVITKGGHSFCLYGSRVLCCQIISLARWLLIRISVTPSDMGEACSLLSFRRSAISMFIWDLWLCLIMTTW